MKFLIGQRVIVGEEIGTVGVGSSPEYQRDGYVWVYLPSKGYAAHYAEHNVKPLPGGQL